MVLKFLEKPESFPEKIRITGKGFGKGFRKDFRKGFRKSIESPPSRYGNKEAFENRKIELLHLCNQPNGCTA